MSESDEHKALVNKIQSYVYEEEVFAKYLKGLMIQKEAGLRSFDEIQMSAIADIEFSHIQKKIYIIGEAKTSMYPINDASGHSIRQLHLYINLLSIQSNPHLIYATPYINIEYTKFEVTHALKKRGAAVSKIQTHFIDLDDLYKI